MSIKNIQVLSLNPHFIAKLIQAFLTGYDKECDINILFFVAPILFYKHAREKLIKAKNSSKMETIFEEKVESDSGMKLSGKVRLAGFVERYREFEKYTKKAIIILSNEEVIRFANKIELLEELDYTKFKGEIKNWLRAACYLGKILNKATSIQINYYLGIEV